MKERPIIRISEGKMTDKHRAALEALDELV